MGTFKKKYTFDEFGYHGVQFMLTLEIMETCIIDGPLNIKTLL